MRANRIGKEREHRAPATPLPAPAATAVAQGGIVADWQRAIEDQFSARPMLPRAPLEDLAYGLSRAIGWIGLVLGYGAISYLIFA